MIETISGAIILCILVAVLVWNRITIFEIDLKLKYRDKLIEEMLGDWLTIYVHSKEESAKGIANRWVGERGELTRF